MDMERLFHKGSFRVLLRLLVEHRRLRRRTIRFIEKKLYQVLVEGNLEHRPPQVEQDRSACLVALLHTVDKAVERGLISKPVLKRLLTVLGENVITNTQDKVCAGRLGFEPPLFLTVSPGQRCNLHCTGCYACSDATTAAKLDFATFDRILTEKEQLWGSYFTVISGGEPFMWEDGGYGLLDMVAKHSSNFFLTFTNGTLINESVAKRLAELGNFAPAISVEGFEAETDERRGKGVYRQVLRAFDNLRQVGVPFGISITATRKNWDVVTSDRFVDFYFQDQGATFGWIFQYMPIGRRHTLELMVTPEQRLEMLKRTWHTVRDRKIFIADFWNSGTASHGCIAAGRPGGYLYIDWNGDITPCVFIPYSTDNIYRIYQSGGNLNTALKSPLIRRIRQWQDNYGYQQVGENTGNWLCPCAIRDHYQQFFETVQLTRARPIDTEAEAALGDPGYRDGLAEYGSDFDGLSAPIWKGEYLSSCQTPEPAEAEHREKALSRR